MPHDVIMPALGMSQDTGLLVSWLKQPGDTIKVGDALMEVETDKAVMEVEAPADGFLDKVSAAAGDHVPVGHVVAVIVDTVNESDTKSETATTFESSSVAIADTQREIKSESVANSTATTRRLTDNDTGKPSGKRILASPKVRRLALEQGLEISRLAELGLPQPYHVADLYTLKNLDSVDQPEGLSTHPSAMHDPSIQRIEALVPSSGCDEFIDWMARNEDIHLPPRMVWLRFATAALRLATGRAHERLSVETRQLNEDDVRYVDADRLRFSSVLDPCDDLLPMLVLFDITDSPITAINGSVDQAPVLTVRRDHDNYVLSLDYGINQLDERQAMSFTNGFAERLGDPLLHLL